MPDVKVSQLNKQFGDNTVLEDVDFTIRDGEFFTLLGPSGCGKSTTSELHRRPRAADERDDRRGGRNLRRQLPEGLRATGGTKPRHGLPVLRAVAAQDDRGQPRDAAADPQDRQGRAAASHRRRPGEGRTSRICAAAIRINCRAGSSSASPWRGRLSTHPRFCCSTNRCPISTQSCASRPERGSSGFSPSWASPPCTSPTTRMRRWRCPIGLR